MSDDENRDFDPAFEALEPAHLVAPVVFNSPHSGCVYPERFLSQVKLDI